MTTLVFRSLTMKAETPEYIIPVARKMAIESVERYAEEHGHTIIGPFSITDEVVELPVESDEDGWPTRWDKFRVIEASAPVTEPVS